MAELDKVKKGLECLARKQEPMANPCSKCDYHDRPNFAFCVVDVATDALELLKEQEEVEPKQGEWIYCEDASGQDGYKCSECGFFEPWYYDFENINFITDYAYCPSCGKPMQEA